MNKRIIMPISILMSLMLVSCGPFANSSSTITSSTDTSTITSTTVDTIDGVLDLYAINDFHGRITTSGSEPGVAKLSTFLKQKRAKNYDNFVFLSSGDTFQDTYDSGYFRGELLAKALPMLGCEAMALGNHEFDWGTEYIVKNQEFASSTTFLGANIYHYDEVNKEVTDFADDLVDEYKIIERSGVKIGIIGIIGENQITSITSTLWDGLIFLEPTEVVKNLSDELRTEKGCDVVVVCAHAGFSDLGYEFANQVTSISPVSNQRYVDTVFTAHTHGFDKEIFNGVPFIQGGSHGEYVSHVQLDVSGETPTLINMQAEFVPNNLNDDKEIKALVDSYLDDEFYKEKNQVIGNIEGASYLSKNIAGNMLAWASYELMKDEAPEIDVVINNGGRSSVDLLENGDITPGLIYDALPFTNKTYVAEVKGSDIAKNIINYPYYAPNALTLNSDEIYTVAVIDYVLFHKNSKREYDKFPSFDGTYSYVETRYSNEIVEQFFKERGSVTIDDLTNLPGYSNLSR